MRRAYDAALEAEGQGCCAVSELDGAAGVGVVIGHSTEESGALDGARIWLISTDFHLGDAVMFLKAPRACMAGRSKRYSLTVSPAHPDGQYPSMESKTLTLSTGGRANLRESGGMPSVSSCCSASE